MSEDDNKSDDEKIPAKFEELIRVGKKMKEADIKRIRVGDIEIEIAPES